MSEEKKVLPTGEKEVKPEEPKGFSVSIKSLKGNEFFFSGNCDFDVEEVESIVYRLLSEYIVRKWHERAIKKEAESIKDREEEKAVKE